MKLLITIVILLFIPFGFSEDKIRIAADEWPPYSSKNLKFEGVMHRIITEAFSLSNIEVEYGYFTGARALDLVKRGRWDATGGWTPSDERAKYFYFSDILLDETIVFFHLKSIDFDWKQWNDLQKIRIGTTIGYFYGSRFEAAKKKLNLTINQTPKDELNFKMLLKHRIELFPSNLDVGIYILKTNFSTEQFDQITYHPKPVDQGPLVLMFSKKSEKSKQLLNIFNYGLRKLKEDGKYAKFLKDSREGKYFK
ncbi:transporter substrate-binding domain-containing protein [Endozoicomonas sp. SM1973]|uniref:Transporter substrate-binding domain-containing protein n=1 Tax=Spartinivicinus marinus TaxID=2994442 RepID=A0A853IDC7_9GAMM|nr:transporter substrate-binding domain-containing protein [Spartinivicinus marinus]MCX4029813.1 transporter substrate-binding domain-containing protein [Spartinivicinus marinus]NYZ67517.1 transporter substrate-binding domain-containing protein [Spartinivicinus marinus]